MFLHLHRLLDLQSSPTVLPLSLSHHVETGRTQRNTLTSLQTSFLLFQGDHSVNVFRWIRGESNSRPQCLHYEGITTICYYCNSFIKSKQRQPAQELRLLQNYNPVPYCLLVRPTMHFYQNAKINNILIRKPSTRLLAEIDT